MEKGGGGKRMTATMGDHCGMPAYAGARNPEFAHRLIGDEKKIKCLFFPIPQMQKLFGETPWEPPISGGEKIFKIRTKE